MAIVSDMAAPDLTVADLATRFGPMPYRRIRQDPPPGSATEQDVLNIHEREKRRYELVDGVLVEKTRSIHESFLAVLLARLLGDFVSRHDLGFVLGADGMARLAPGLVRIPDVSFVAWNQVSGHAVPRLPMLNFAPQLAVEILSPSNTDREMERKLQDYSAAGTRLVWYIDPATRTVQVFTAADQATLLREEDELHGEPVLPGLAVPVRELFAQLGP